jgi:hypothetical protein
MLNFIGNKKGKMPLKPYAEDISAYFRPIAETLI